MIDASNLDTVRSIRELFDQIQNRSKQVVFWVGAGASCWCEYPRWPELAERFHSQYIRYEPTYIKERGLDLLSSQKFPELFQICRNTNSQRFYSLIADSFPAREPTSVYRRFVDALRGMSPAGILTTNVDELLEKQLPNLTTIGRHDLQRAEQLLRVGQAFVCKLHGSVSDVMSTVFTVEDYNTLLSDDIFKTHLERLLAATTVVFIGYSLQDDYVLSMLARNRNINALFGDGPHYAILPTDYRALPSNVRVIRYTPEPHKDHRSPITVLEEIRSIRTGEANDKYPIHSDTKQPNSIQSAHLLFDIFPPGTWSTSVTLGISDPSGTNRQAIIGTGFTDIELPDNRSTAMHDLIVGLLCFDHVYASISSLGRVHNLLGTQRFWHLVQDGVLSFVTWDHQECIIFPSADSLSAGDLGSLSHYKPDGTKQTIMQIVRTQLNPTPGNEDTAERLFERLCASTREVSSAEEGAIPSIVRSLLLRPSIRRLLGVSGGMPLNSLTRWNAFPILRLANVVKIGTACRILQIGSAKLNFGTANLAGPAFAAATGVEWADDTASYVLSGRFAADLGAFALQDPSLLDLILTFRNTKQGQELRQEVFARLAASEGSDVTVAVNAGLRNALPSTTLQKARDTFVNLLTPQRSIPNTPAVIWNDRRFAEDALVLWRRRSREMLEQYCLQNKISTYSACPCGSGEKLKFCCAEALVTSK